MVKATYFTDTSSNYSEIGDHRFSLFNQKIITTHLISKSLVPTYQKIRSECQLLIEAIVLNIYKKEWGKLKWEIWE